MTATIPKLLTEREFKIYGEIETETLDRWIEEGFIEPIKVMEGNYLYYPRHLESLNLVKGLISQGFTEIQIKQHLENGTIDVEGLQNLLPDYENMSLLELKQEARNEHIRLFGSMSREQLIVCLTDINRRAEIIEEVRLARQYRLNQQDNDNQANDIEEVVIENEIEDGLDENPVNQEDGNDQEVAYSMDELSTLQHIELIRLAKVENIKYFRQMKKAQLIQCLAFPALRAETIEQVRMQTRERYGNNNETRRVTTNNLTATVIEVETESVEQIPTENNVDVQSESNVVEQVELTLENNEQVAETPEVIVATMQDGTEVTIQMTPFTALTEAQMLSMGTKNIGSAARDANLFPYFRRMNKRELIDALLNPEERLQYVTLAWERYQLYAGRVYGQNRRQ